MRRTDESTQTDAKILRNLLSGKETERLHKVADFVIIRNKVKSSDRTMPDFLKGEARKEFGRPDEIASVSIKRNISTQIIVK